MKTAIATVLALLLLSGCAAPPTHRAAGRPDPRPSSTTAPLDVSLGPAARPTFVTTLLAQPGWSLADGTDLNAPTKTFHHSSGCFVVVDQSMASHYAPGGLDDTHASALVLATLAGGDTVGVGGVTFGGGVEGLGAVVPTPDGPHAYLVVRSFAAAGIDMSVLLLCPGSDVTADMFGEYVLPYLEIDVDVP